MPARVPGAGYPAHLLAARGLGLLSTEPGPAGALEASGRYAVVGGFVMFVAEGHGHGAALAGSGLPPSPGATVGFYTARRAAADDPWRFVSIGHFRLGGNRAQPDPDTWEVARRAFLQSGHGDVGPVLDGRRA